MQGYLLKRVSTERQKEAGNSLPAQDFRLSKYAKDKSIDIVKEFEFDESAYKGKRSDFSEVMKALKVTTEPVALLCDKIDRLIRNFTRDLITLEELRVKGLLELHFPSDNLVLHRNSPANDLFRFSVGVSLAKYYSDAISDNVKRAIGNKLRNGEWPGKAPIGYLNIEREDETKWIVVDKERNQTVQKMFEWYSTGKYSMGMIRKKVKEEGLRNHTDSLITKSQVEQILTNPFYYGVMRYDGELYPHVYEPIISKDLFDKVQSVRKGWNKKPFQYAAKPLTYRGVLTCKHCGCTISFYEKKDTVYGRCTNGKHVCEHVTPLKEEDIDDQLEDVLTNLVLPESVLEELVEDLKTNHKAKSDYHRKAISTLHNQYEKLETRLERVYEDWLDRSITQDMRDRLMSKYKEEQHDVLSKMENHKKADESYYLGATKLLELSQKAWDLYKNSQPDKKNELLKYLLANGQMDEEKLVFTLNKPFDAIYAANKTQSWLPVIEEIRTCFV